MKINVGKPLSFGFDIGIASVGWAVLTDDHIVALGVRAFNKAETAKEGESLNLARRVARLTRRRLRRRAWRLNKLTRLLIKFELIEDVNFFKDLPLDKDEKEDVWQLRVDGLERRLKPEELARVIYHIVKHRGFYWKSKAEEAGATSGEGGLVKQGLSSTQALMTEKQYRTVAEMVINEFPLAHRNKQGEYTKALARIHLADELAKILVAQQKLGNTLVDSELVQALLGNGDRKSGLMWEQKPSLTGNALLKMLGKCTFEKDEFRAPKASFSAERHVWLTTLNNLRINANGVSVAISASLRSRVINQPYVQAGDFTYKQLRKILADSGEFPGQFTFLGLRYPSTRDIEEGRAKDPESARLSKLQGWHKIRETMNKAGLESEWKAIADKALNGGHELLNQITFILSVYKETDEVVEQLGRLEMFNKAKVIEALTFISFDQFHSLSIKALDKILPHMEQGMRYDEACLAEGYHHSDRVTGKDRSKYLPPLYIGRDSTGRMKFDDRLDVPRNPVVLRSLNQARKVLNALIRKYGSPSEIHVEMARDLSRDLSERNKIKKEQDTFRQRNDDDRKRFAEDFGFASADDVGGSNLLKFQLYREQLGKCAYSLNPIDLNRLLEHGYVEVDHILPYSRSFDDSKNNKVLVLSRYNQDKGGRTPFEYLNGASESPEWLDFEAWVNSNKNFRQAKKSRLLQRDFGQHTAEGFRERNLNDTRYICRFFKNFIDENLLFADGSTRKRTIVLNGGVTSLLRARWGLIKVREESDRHHALDAAVIAACTNGMIQRVAGYSKRKEIAKAKAVVDIETGEIYDKDMLEQLEQHFPMPFEHFRDELLLRLYETDGERLKNDLSALGTYSDDELEAVRPIFVSRAPLRRRRGAAHKETIYGQGEYERLSGTATKRIPVNRLQIKDLPALVEPERNYHLYRLIEARLIEFSGKADKAFKADNPLRRPDKEGNPTGPIVRAVTMNIGKISGVPVRGGIAENGTMIRSDIFKKGKRYYVVPIYVTALVSKDLPNRAIVAYKDEEDWTLIDDTFEFCFSLYPNDLVEIKLTKRTERGYYSGVHRGTSAITIWDPYRDPGVGKDGLISCGAPTAISITKFNVDVLGEIHPYRFVPRDGLA